MINRKELLSIIKKYDTEDFKDYSKDEKINLTKIIEGLQVIKDLLELGNIEYLNITYRNKGMYEKALTSRQYSSLCNCFDEVYKGNYGVAFHNIVEFIDNFNDLEENFTLHEIIDISLCVRLIETNLKVAS